MNYEIITFLGEPGSGKSTRMNYLSNYKKICSAQLLIDEGYDLSSGSLIADEIIIKLILKEIEKSNSNIILDGFPRTINQLNALIENNIYIDKVYRICTPYNIIIERVKSRLTCVDCHESFTTNDFKKPKQNGLCDYCGGILIKRNDDDIEILKKRLIEYKKHTEPLINEYLKYSIPIIDIDGEAEPNIILTYEEKTKGKILKKAL